MSRDPYRMPASFDAWLTTDSVAEDAYDEASRLEAAVEEFGDEAAANVIRAEVVAHGYLEMIESPGKFDAALAESGALGFLADSCWSPLSYADARRMDSVALTIGRAFLEQAHAYVGKLAPRIEAECLRMQDAMRGGE